GTLGEPEADSIYAYLCGWGDDQKQGHQGRGESARETEGDGWCAGHVHTREGIWALGRRGRRPPRGLAPAQRPRTRGFFACVPHASKRGKALRQALLEWLMTEDPGIQYEP